MTEAAPGLSVRGLSKIFGPAAAGQLPAVRQGLSKAELQARNGHVLALHDINIDMPGAAVTVVMGLSGSGKSTLLRLLNRLIEPTAGQVLAGPVDVTALGPQGLREFRRRQTAMVFQRFALFPHHNVLRNVAYALELRAVPAAERDAAARRWIERVGLAGFERRWPAELSGGMQQRVGDATRSRSMTRSRSGGVTASMRSTAPWIRARRPVALVVVMDTCAPSTVHTIADICRRLLRDGPEVSSTRSQQSEFRGVATPCG